MPDTPNRVGERWTIYKANVERDGDGGNVRGPVTDEWVEVVRYDESAEQARDRAVEERDEATKQLDRAWQSLSAAMHKGSLHVRPEIAEKLVRDGKNSVVLAARALDHELDGDVPSTQPIDRDRAVEALREIDPDQLHQIAQRLGILGDNYAQDKYAIYHAEKVIRSILQEREPDATV